MMRSRSVDLHKRLCRVLFAAELSHFDLAESFPESGSKYEREIDSCEGGCDLTFRWM